MLHQAGQKHAIAAPHRPAGPGPAGAGFTLVELVMVMAIVTVAAAIAVPRYAAGMDRYRVANAANRIAADLALARAEAVRTSSPRTIVFETSVRRYSVANLPDLDRRGTTLSVELAASPYFVKTLWVGSNPPVANLSYNGFGQPNTTAFIFISTGQNASLITVDRISGKVVIQ